MDAPSPPLALRLHGLDHALEPGRDYLLGSDEGCDFRLPAVASRHTKISVHAGGATVVDLGAEAGTRRNGESITQAPLTIGDVLRLGDHEAIVIPDRGEATIVPVPAMRAAATANRLRAVRVAAAQLRRGDDATFQDLVATELRRAPWLALSAFCHLLLLLLLWVLYPVQPVARREMPSLSLDEDASGSTMVDTSAPTPPVVPEPHEPVFTESVAAATESTDHAPLPDDGPPRRPTEIPPANERLARRPARVAGAPGAANGDALSGIGSGDFRQAVSELRKAGLEIVFVFDSTGSMSRTIADTKSSIEQMLAVLQALVPDARFGLVTYRDRGRREEYVTRQVALGLDPWQAVNFVQFVTAEGGGDRPEEVRAGLRAAFEQNWQSGTRRVVVLAGDAPPHEEDWKHLQAEVQRFAQNGRSFVHTLITSPDPPPHDTAEAFRRIATAGHGLCERLDDRARVLQRVLNLAFGREFDQDLTSVIAAVDQAQQRVDVEALDLVRRGGPRLTEALRQKPVPRGLWNALVRRPHRAAAEQLVALLAATDTPDHSRQAIAAALQRIFDLPLPPIDPNGERNPTPGELRRLRELAGRLPQ